MKGDIYLNIFMAALIIEALTETLKLAFKNYEKFTLGWSLLNLALGILICYNYRLDLLLSIGLTDHIPNLGCILTGILISRGSNYMHDLVNKLPKNSTVVNEITKEVAPKNIVQTQSEITLGNERTIVK